jgi:hypothetical protein
VGTAEAIVWWTFIAFSLSRPSLAERQQPRKRGG